MDGHDSSGLVSHKSMAIACGQFPNREKKPGYGSRSSFLQKDPKYFLSLQLHAFFTGLAALYSLLRENASREEHSIESY